MWIPGQCLTVRVWGVRDLITIARVDDRLIHGQITVGWVRRFGVTRIVVVDDDVAKDPLQSTMTPMAAPPGIGAEVRTVEQFTADYKAGKYDKYRLMLIFTVPSVPLALIKAGIPIEGLNLGGMKFIPGRKQITRAVSVSPEEETVLKEIMELGTEVFIQMLPEHQKVDVKTLLPVS